LLTVNSSTASPIFNVNSNWITSIYSTASFKADIKLGRYISDYNGATGPVGYVLTATARGTYWAPAGSGGNQGPQGPAGSGGTGSSSGGSNIRQIGMAVNLSEPGLTGPIRQTLFGIGYTASIFGWYMAVDTATNSVIVEVWKRNGASPNNPTYSIVAAAPPNIPVGGPALDVNSSTDMTGWNRTIIPGDYLMMNIQNNDGDVSYINLQLLITMT
jgi:hypothetical protein